MRSTFEVGDPSGRGVSYYGPATTVRIHPSGDECCRLALLEQTPLLSISPSERPLSCPLPTQSDVLGAFHDCMPRLPCTLSGNELPIDYLDVPAAAQGHRCGFLRRFARLACDARRGRYAAQPQAV